MCHFQFKDKFPDLQMGCGESVSTILLFYIRLHDHIRFPSEPIFLLLFLEILALALHEVQNTLFSSHLVSPNHTYLRSFGLFLAHLWISTLFDTTLWSREFLIGQQDAECLFSVLISQASMLNIFLLLVLVVLLFGVLISLFVS